MDLDDRILDATDRIAKGKRRRVRLTMPEKSWQDQIRQVAGLYGGLHYHTHTSRRSEPGFPDSVIARPPVLFLWELKVGSGRLTPAQLRWAKEIQACTRLHYATLRPADLPAAARLLATAREGEAAWDRLEPWELLSDPGCTW